MPELPDIEAYRHALTRAIVPATLHAIRIDHPFLLRSVGVDPDAAVGHRVVSVERLGKRIVICFEGGPFYVVHLMIAGRLRFKPGAELPAGRRPGSRSGPLAHFAFSTGLLSLTEAGTRRRASLHVVADRAELESLDPGGAELLDGGMTAERFASLIRAENHTIKRTLTDPRLFSGIGNAYSDEILFHAGLSPFLQSGNMTDDQIERLFEATITTLTSWRDLLVAEALKKFPSKVTAFRPEMAVHGRYNEPCTVCGTPIQRIRYAENESNYCPGCQTGGRVYADRALSRLLKGDWPRTVEELENLRGGPGRHG
jgi:formamidopyrimidine-DNA glycosylase